MLESGVCRGKEIAAAEKIKASDFSRVLRLTLLASEVVPVIVGAAILDGLSRRS